MVITVVCLYLPNRSVLTAAAKIIADMMLRKTQQTLKHANLFVLL